MARIALGIEDKGAGTEIAFAGPDTMQVMLFTRLVNDSPVVMNTMVAMSTLQVGDTICWGCNGDGYVVSSVTTV